jgi:protein O-mannosyl-transferase
LRARLVPLLVAFVTVLAFLPALGNGFVNWDDDQNVLENLEYRGLGWVQLRWMFTTSLMGHYIPLTWLTLGMDYLVWGMNPAGYHVTNLLLHAAAAATFYAVALRLLATGLTGRHELRSLALPAGAVFAALLFAIHPLRVESVAWVTERRDVLSGLLYLLTLLVYLGYCESTTQRDGRARRRYWACLALFALALLAKSMSVTLPVILLILDWYPLRRLQPRTVRAVLTEKIPFLALSVGAGLMAVAAVSNVLGLGSMVRVGLVERVAITAYSLVFYLVKTVIPLSLAAVYERPVTIDPGAWPFVASGAVALLLTVLAIALRRRWPALAAVWASYVVILLPVAGIVQNGPQNDRYTYLACGGWAMLAGAGLALGMMAGRRAANALAALAVAVVGGLSVLTWNQVKVWHDSETLWTHTVAVQPSALGHFKLGVTLAHQGKFNEAIDHFQTTLRINPGYASAHSAWGYALAIQGKTPEATEHFHAALRLNPRDAEARSGLDFVVKHREK